MNIIRTLSIFILPTFLTAEVTNSNFLSPYPSSFKKLSSISTTTDSTSGVALYKVSFTNDSMSKSSNFRLFVPDRTYSLSVKTSRVGSSGWFTFAVSLGNLPSIYTANGTLKTSYQGNTELPITSNSDYTLAGSMNYSTYTDELISGTTLLTGHDASSYDKLLQFNTNTKRTNLNKWLLFASDTRPDASGNANGISAVNLTVRYKFIKSEINSYIDDLSTSKQTELRNQCTGYEDSTVKMCMYLNLFGGDGQDNDFTTYSQTADEFISSNSDITIANPTTLYTQACTGTDNQYTTENFTASGSSSNSYSWALSGDGAIGSTSGSTTTVTYDTNTVKTYSTTLTATDSAGDVGSTTYSFSVYKNLALTQDKEITVAPNQEFTYDASDLIICKATENTSDTWLYTIKKGSETLKSENSKDILYTFDESGEYTIDITAENDTTTIKVTVKELTPPEFKSSTPNIDVPENLQYTYDLRNLLADGSTQPTEWTINESPIPDGMSISGNNLIWDSPEATKTITIAAHYGSILNSAPEVELTLNVKSLEIVSISNLYNNITYNTNLNISNISNLKWTLCYMDSGNCNDISTSQLGNTSISESGEITFDTDSITNGNYSMKVSVYQGSTFIDSKTLNISFGDISVKLSDNQTSSPLVYSSEDDQDLIITVSSTTSNAINWQITAKSNSSDSEENISCSKEDNIYTCDLNPISKTGNATGYYTLTINTDSNASAVKTLRLFYTTGPTADADLGTDITPVIMYLLD